jgi:hypothetical protein
MKVYIAGPMSGYPDMNFPAFDKKAEELRAQGYEVVNPAEKDRANGYIPQPEGFCTEAQYKEFLMQDLPLVASCDAIYLLRGWARSRGARLERHLAKVLGLTIWYQS